MPQRGGIIFGRSLGTVYLILRLTLAGTVALIGGAVGVISCVVARDKRAWIGHAAAIGSIIGAGVVDIAAFLLLQTVGLLALLPKLTCDAVAGLYGMARGANAAFGATAASTTQRLSEATQVLATEPLGSIIEKKQPGLPPLWAGKTSTGIIAVMLIAEHIGYRLQPCTTQLATTHSLAATLYPTINAVYHAFEQSVAAAVSVIATEEAVELSQQPPSLCRELQTLPTGPDSNLARFDPKNLVASLEFLMENPNILPALTPSLQATLQTIKPMLAVFANSTIALTAAQDVDQLYQQITQLSPEQPQLLLDFTYGSCLFTKKQETLDIAFYSAHNNFLAFHDGIQTPIGKIKRRGSLVINNFPLALLHHPDNRYSWLHGLVTALNQAECQNTKTQHLLYWQLKQVTTAYGAQVSQTTSRWRNEKLNDNQDTLNHGLLVLHPLLPYSDYHILKTMIMLVSWRIIQPNPFAITQANLAQAVDKLISLGIHPDLRAQVVASFPEFTSSWPSATQLDNLTPAATPPITTFALPPIAKIWQKLLRVKDEQQPTIRELSCSSLAKDFFHDSKIVKYPVDKSQQGFNNFAYPTVQNFSGDFKQMYDVLFTSIIAKRTVVPNEEKY